SGSTSITLSGITSDARGVFFRQGAASHGQSFVDNLNVSVDFNTAAALAAVPEPSTYAAILGAMALIGALVVRRLNLVA
uniref:PEP-CTERM sorting domain-containing protein n=1 Tax=Cephaloticoccus sp. TaxID=1985742 RepID=UPI00404A05DA